jgi:hypothetical protein
VAAPRARLKRKNLETDTSGLDLLQAFEIPQNHQDILWKSLEKTSGNLEMFGKSLEQVGAARPSAACCETNP